MKYQQSGAIWDCTPLPSVRNPQGFLWTHQILKVQNLTIGPWTILNKPNIKMFKVSFCVSFQLLWTNINNHFQVSGGELYDVVASQKSGVSVLALRKLWDERQGHPVEPAKKLPAQQLNDSLPPPALPPKCKNRKLAGAVSIDTVPPTQVQRPPFVLIILSNSLFTSSTMVHLQFQTGPSAAEHLELLPHEEFWISTHVLHFPVLQVAPPLPNRGLALNTSLRESSPFTTPHPSLTQVDLKRSQSPRGITNSDQRDLESLYPEGTGREFPEVGQVDNMSRPSGRLNSNVDEDESSSPPLTYSPSRPKKITCPTYSLHEPEPSSSGSNPGAEDAEVFRSNPLYHTTEGSEVWSTQQESVMYSEVPQRSTSTSRINNTYEQVPKEPDQVNMYESVEEMKAKKKSTWGKNVSERTGILNRGVWFNCVLSSVCRTWNG